MNEYIQNLPERIGSSILMKQPNEIIPIYSGHFQLKQNYKLFEMNGSILYKWLPSNRAFFSGIIEQNSNGESQIVQLLEKAQLIIDGLVFGDCNITHISIPNEIEGTISGAVKGDKTIPVTKLRFGIPNLRSFHGVPIKSIGENGKTNITASRLLLENQEYSIAVDKVIDYDDLEKSLSAQGGYIILYSGELTKKNGHILFDEVKEIQHCLLTFLSFLNGIRCSPIFIQGVFEDKVIWSDFSNYIIDPYKEVSTWTLKYNINGLNELWQTFGLLWKNENDKDFLITAIHWYIEANSNSGFVEGSIIMAQTALELIYNYYIIEKMKMLVGKDSENITAANKIRLLISQLKIGKEIPVKLTNIRAFLDSNLELSDGVDVFVMIRNAIIHSQEDKRKKLTKIPLMVKFEALELSLWYIELSLLYILNYKDEYHNRCSSELWVGNNDTLVPWAKQKS